MDSDAPIWNDHDNRIHGDPVELIEGGDSMYDEGAIWNCCQPPGDVEGCVRSRHKPVDAFGKKRRLSQYARCAGQRRKNRVSNSNQNVGVIGATRCSDIHSFILPRHLLLGPSSSLKSP